MNTQIRFIVLALLVFISVYGCASGTPSSTSATDTPDAKKFIDDVNETMLKLGTEASQAAWVSENFITEDTEALNARANQRYIEAIAKFAKDAVKFDKANVAPDIRRGLTF